MWIAYISLIYHRATPSITASIKLIYYGSVTIIFINI